MRKMTRDVFKAWQLGRKCKPSASIWTNGDTIYSYSKPILRNKHGRTVMNIADYSPVTYEHQQGIRELLADAYQTPIAYTREPSDLF